MGRGVGEEERKEIWRGGGKSDRGGGGEEGEARRWIILQRLHELSALTHPPFLDQCTPCGRYTSRHRTRPRPEHAYRSKLTHTCMYTHMHSIM